MCWDAKRKAVVLEAAVCLEYRKPLCQAADADEQSALVEEVLQQLVAEQKLRVRGSAWACPAGLPCCGISRCRRPTRRSSSPWSSTRPRDRCPCGWPTWCGATKCWMRTRTRRREPPRRGERTSASCSPAPAATWSPSGWPSPCGGVAARLRPERVPCAAQLLYVRARPAARGGSGSEAGSEARSKAGGKGGAKAAGGPGPAAESSGIDCAGGPRRRGRQFRGQLPPRRLEPPARLRRPRRHPALAKHFNLTLAEADQVKRNPALAPSVHQFYAAIEPVLTGSGQGNRVLPHLAARGRAARAHHPHDRTRRRLPAPRPAGLPPHGPLTA